MKIKATDGKRRLTDVAGTEQLLLIIQSIPSPKAGPFKLWVEGVADLDIDSSAYASNTDKLLTLTKSEK